MYYFAYGSNMNHDQMRKRCPRSRFIKRVFLRGYRFVYDGDSSTRNSSVANILESQDAIIWGGLFEINRDNLASLDCYEGYPRSYQRTEVDAEDESGNIFKAVTYLRQGENGSMPDQEYRDIVIQGAKDCHLPEEYVEGNL